MAYDQNEGRTTKIARPKVVVGEKSICFYPVRLEDTIHFSVDPRLPKILGSFVLMKWMEVQCGQSVQEKLSEKYITLGNKFTITHGIPAFISEQVEIQSELVKQIGWTLHFCVAARCNDRLVATSEHTRNIVPAKMFNRYRKER